MKMKKIYIYLVLTLTINQVGFSQPNIQGFIDSGNQNLKNRNFKEAVADFEKALKAQPSDTSALGGIIKACLLGDDLKEAQKQIDNAVKLYPNDPEFIFRRGILNNKKGQFDKAVEDFESALNMESSSSLKVQIYLNLGASQLRLEAYDNALNNYKKALDLSPRNPSIYNYKGYANYKLGSYIDAINDFNNAIDLDPNNPASYYNRGMAYLKTAGRSNACLDFHKSCSLGNINACKMIMTECQTK